MKFSTEGVEDYVTDGGAETQGITIKISDTVSFRCRRAGGRNMLYERALSKHSRPYMRRIRNGIMGNDELKWKILLPTYLDAVIIGWDGVTDEEGDDVPFGRGTCSEYLEAFPNVFDELVSIASDMAAFRAQEDEEVVERVGES